MRVGVVGINHKLANVQLRERLAKACQRRFVPGNCIHSDHTFVLLTTCNRTEVYFTSEDLTATHSYLLQILRFDVEEEFDQKVYSYFGYDCFLHLSRVTAGLDSAIIAETEIQGQVKAAYESALEYIPLPGELHYLFQKALRIGKKVRVEVPMGRGMPDLEHAIFNVGAHLFKDREASILFVGASMVNQKILSFLKSKNLQNITLCNRTLERAKTVAEIHDLKVLEWSQMQNWHQYDWVIVGTKASDCILTRAHLPLSCKRHKLLIDLCVPRNIEPKLARDPHISLLNIDQINRILRVRKQQMSHVLSKAEQLVSTAAKKHVDLFKEKESYRHQLQLIGA
jgi:glutamyl-tRNA reductase